MSILEKGGGARLTDKANQQVFEVLETSKMLTDSFLDEMPLLLAMVDDDIRLLKLNILGQRLLGQDEKAVLGTPLADHVPISTMDRLLPYFAESRHVPGTEVSFEDELVVAGEIRHVHWQITRASARPDRRGIHLLIGKDTTEARLALERFVELRRDLEVARLVQTMLVPKPWEVSGACYEMVGYYEPAQQVGGDLWWHRDVEGLGMLTLVGDVTGHGAGPAMVAATLAGMLAATLKRAPLTSADDVAPFLQEVADLIRATFRSEYFICFGAVLVEEAAHRATVVGAGFPGLIKLPKAGVPARINASGDPMGVSARGDFVAAKIDFAPGDRVVICSDGCFEQLHRASTRASSLFKEIMAAHRAEPLKVALQRSVEDIHRQALAAMPADDVTLVMIERKP